MPSGSIPRFWFASFRPSLVFSPALGAIVLHTALHNLCHMLALQLGAAFTIVNGSIGIPTSRRALRVLPMQAQITRGRPD